MPLFLLHRENDKATFYVYRCSNSIGSLAAWDASGTEFDPCVQRILSLGFGHENISQPILPLPMIQEDQLSVNAKRMYVKYW